MNGPRKGSGQRRLRRSEIYNITRLALVIAVLGLIFGAVYTVARAQGGDRKIVPPPVPIPMPIPPQHPIIQRDLTLTDMKVDIKVTGGVASTTIRQTLRNDNQWVAEGQYMLPLPAGANVSGFALIDGDQRLEPQTLPKDEARRVYEDIVRKMRDPGLLEYINSTTFSVAVFPFQPGQSRTVEVSFSQTLGGTTELQSYLLPLRWAGWSRIGDYNGVPFTLTYDIDSSYPLGTISSPTFGLSVNRNGDNKASGSYEGKLTHFGNDFTLNIGRRSGDFGASLLLYPGDKGEDGYFLLSLLAALPRDAKYVPKDVLFVFDKSGSMSGDKIEQAKGALRYVLGRLQSEDRFNLIYFSDGVNPVFEGLKPASADNTAAARSAVDGLTADGGTDINSALSQGSDMLRGGGKQELGSRPRYVVFLTDGQPTVGETNIDSIIANAKSKFDPSVKLFVFGCGYDVNTTLLDTLSYDHHGSASYVSEGEDIEVKVSQFYAKIASPALIDLKLNLDGLDEYDITPAQLPDLFHNTELFISGRYRGTPGSVTVNVSGSGDGGKQRTYTAKVTPVSGRQNNQVARLWATRKVSFLLDQIRLKGDNQELINEVDRLATRFGIVTPYTSYLITEPGMYFDRDARNAQLLDGMIAAREDESGEMAVGRSKQAQMNQAADNAAAPQSAGATAGGGGGTPGNLFDPMYGQPAPAPKAEKDRKGGSADSSTTVNYVNSQTFVRQGDGAPDKEGRAQYQWVDARYEAKSQRSIKVQAYSSEYFELLDEYPELGDYLSQGENVVLVLNDKLVLETTLAEVKLSSSELRELKEAISDSNL